MVFSYKIDPFATSAIERFCTKVSTLLQQDLNKNISFATTFSQYAKQVLLKEKALALLEIASALETSGVREQWNAVLRATRSEVIAEWVAPYFVGSLLDLLCGEGRVGKCIAESGIDVTLAEREGAYSHVKQQRQLPYFPLNKLVKTLPTLKFDCVLLCTVLHHEFDPEAMLSLGVQFARKRLILIENCLEPENPNDYQILVDIFFNHCLNQTTLDSPASHKSLHDWVECAARYGDIIKTDRKETIPGIPLSHNLIVVDLRG